MASAAEDEGRWAEPVSGDRFKLAPMDSLIYWMTAILLPLPAVVVGIGYLATGTLNALFPAALLVVVGLIVWLFFRPTRFELGPEGLRIVWPVYSSLVHRTKLVGARILTRRDFKLQYGRATRVGAGGLWGAFGWAVTPRGTLRMYVSRIDRFVLVETKETKPLLLTPDNPELFVETLRTQVADSS